MFTQCPECSTAFRVTAEVLKKAAGQVRCGGCGVTFNALEHLSEDMPITAPRAQPHEHVPELTPETNDDQDSSVPQTISAEQSAALLKTLDELAGSNIQIEDTGIEWRVLDTETSNDEPDFDAEKAAESQLVADTGTMKFILEDDEDDSIGDASDIFESPGETFLDSNLQQDSGDSIIDEFLTDSPTPVDEFLTATPSRVESPEVFSDVESDAAPEVMRFDDNTPLPDDFGLGDPTPYVAEPPKPLIERHVSAPDLDDAQIDLALGDPDEWELLLGEVELPPEADTEAAALENEEIAEEEALEPAAEEAISEVAADTPLDMDTQFAIQAEAMGIDLSGMHKSVDDEDATGVDELEAVDENDAEDVEEDRTSVAELDASSSDELDELADDDSNEDLEAEVAEEPQQIDESDEWSIAPNKDDAIEDELDVDSDDAEYDDIDDLVALEDSIEEESDTAEMDDETVIKTDIEDEDDSEGDHEGDLDAADEAGLEQESDDDAEDESAAVSDDSSDDSSDDLSDDERHQATEDELDEELNEDTCDELDESPDEKPETSIDEDLIAAAFESEAAQLAEEDEAEEEPDDSADASGDDPETSVEHYVPPQTEEEKTINMMIDQDFMRLAAEGEDIFTSTTVEDRPDFDNNPSVETIVMEGEFIRNALDRKKLAGDAAAGSRRFDDTRFSSKLADDAKPGQRGGRRDGDPASFGVIAGIIALALLLIAQALHQSRQALATIPAFNNAIGPIYRTVGYPLTPNWDIAGWRFEVTNSSIDESGDLLTVYSRIGNQSDDSLPYPLVQLSLLDRFEEIIGSKVLEPREYLSGNPDPRKAVEPGNTFNAVISIESPAGEATSFKLNVCYRLANRQLRCAIEDFK
jgi:predicted Zn finger-like uncharacterized protein